MKKSILILISTLGLSFSTFAYNVNPNKITVSGISAGAFFANQLHISHSSLISGVAMIAGGPYNCSEGNVNRALNSCMKTSQGAISIDQIVSDINTLQKNDQIDPMPNLPSAKIFLMSGVYDDVVATEVVKATADMYMKLKVPAKNIKFIDDLDVGHAFPTLDYGNSCKTARSAPFISRCNYDGAFEILNYLYGSLKPKTVAVEENLKFISQKKYFSDSANSSSSSLFPFPLPFSSKGSTSLGDEAAIYVPTACQNGAECALHVSFHGCMQSRDDVGDDYFRKTGFNEWAENNNIIVLYPQAVKNYVLGNPNSCFDWWGYTGHNYHTKDGVQIKIITKMIEEIIKK